MTETPNMNRAMMWTVLGVVIVGLSLVVISPMISDKGPSSHLEDRLISYQPMNMPSGEMCILAAGNSSAEQSGGSLPGVMLAGVLGTVEQATASHGVVALYVARTVVDKFP